MSALTPLHVDPDVRQRIRPMALLDVPRVAELHAEAMGRSLWAQLGEGFLRAVYRGLVRHPDFVGYVYEEAGRVLGFIAGTADGPKMTAETMLRRAPHLGAAAAIGLLRRPAAARPLLQTLTYFDHSGVPAVADVRAESMFCTFEPDLRGRRVSGLINKVLFDDLAARGHRFVKITTDEDNASAKRQLQSWGFQQVGRFSFYGKPMLAWRLDLLQCERVDHPHRES